MSTSAVLKKSKSFYRSNCAQGIKYQGSYINVHNHPLNQSLTDNMKYTECSRRIALDHCENRTTVHYFLKTEIVVVVVYMGGVYFKA
jgi:hypothetical protein